MRRGLQITLMLALALLGTGCSTKNGSISNAADFIPPNSNLVPIGPVTVEESWHSIILPPTFDKEDYYVVKNKLLRKAMQADTIVDYRVDVTVTQWFPLPLIGIISPYTMTVTARGTAAKLEMGNQRLR